MGNKPTIQLQNRKNEDLEDEKSMRIGIGFNKGSARVEGNLLVGCLHRRKKKSKPQDPVPILKEEPPSEEEEEEEEPLEIKEDATE